MIDYEGCNCRPHSLRCSHCSACIGHLFSCPVSDPYRWITSSSEVSRAEANRWIGRLANIRAAKEELRR